MDLVARLEDDAAVTTMDREAESVANDPEAALSFRFGTRLIPTVIEDAMLAGFPRKQNVGVFAGDGAVDFGIVNESQIVAARGAFGAIDVDVAADVGAKVGQRDFVLIGLALNHDQAGRAAFASDGLDGRRGADFGFDPNEFLAGAGELWRGTEFHLEVGREAEAGAGEGGAEVVGKKFGEKAAFEGAGLLLGHAAEVDADEVVAEDAGASDVMAFGFHCVDNCETDLFELGRGFGQGAAGEGRFENGSAEFFNRVGKRHSYLSELPFKITSQIIPSSCAASMISRASGAADSAP